MASSNKILRVFLDVNMQKGHKGLMEHAKKYSVSVLKLQPQEHVVFINSKGDKMKIYSANNVVSYRREDKKLELGTLQHFAECFGADGFAYDEALKKVLLKKMYDRHGV